MNEKTLLIKLGRHLKTHRKRYCQYQGSGVFIYFSSFSSTKPKGCFKLENKGFTYKETQSFLKTHAFCIEICLKKCKKLWLFPKNQASTQEFLRLFAKLSIYKEINQDLTPRLKSKTAKNSKNIRISKKSRSLDASFAQESFLNEAKTIDFINKPAFFCKGETLLEEEAEDSQDLEDLKRFLCEEILCEGHLPFEIKEISCILQQKSHEFLFNQALNGEYKEKKQVLGGVKAISLTIPDFCSTKEQSFKQNKTVFQQYQEEKKSFAQHFVFPKREDSFNITTMKSLEFDKEVLLSLGQQFLWEFQLENAAKVFAMLKDEDFEFSQGFIEIEVMKVLISGKKNLILNLLEKLQTQKNLVENVKTQTCEGFLLVSEILLIKGLLSILLQSKFQAFLALKEAYNNLKKSENLIKKGSVPSNNGFSRYLLISGTFEIGLSLLPSQFRKILELLGVSLNKNEGISNLNKCILQGRARAHYARIILSLYYIENQASTSFDEAFKLIKEALSILSKSPLVNWLASLFSWRFLQGTESTKLILRSLSNIGGELVKEAYYLKFELGWFEMSRCQWLSALAFFEELAIVSLDLFNFDEKMFFEIAKNFKDLPLPAAFKTLINRANSLENGLLEEYPAKNIENSENRGKNYKNIEKPKKNTIILPHRNTLALIISICYINLNEDKLCEVWLHMIHYIDKKFAGDSLRTAMDEDISRLARKYLTRSYKFFLKYEVLYFLKEISKLKDAYLLQMKSNIEVFFQETFGLALLDHQTIFALIKKNPLERDFICEYASGLFLIVVILCILRKLDLVMQCGEAMKDIRSFVPKECEYLLHHTFHWVGRAKLIIDDGEGKENVALEFLRLSKKYQECEFTMRNKNNKTISEILVILNLNLNLKKK